MTTHTVDVAPGTIGLFSDLTCPFAHVAVHRIFTARNVLGLDGQLHIDHRVFPIELLNTAPGTRHGSDSEIPVLGALERDAGWQLWQGPDYHYPSTVLPAFEAVQAAKAQGLDVSERLDRALRRAFWARSRPIHLHHEILAVDATVENLDSDRLDADLRAGTSRRAIFDDLDVAQSGAVTMSPHLFLPDGTSHANPGVTVHWQGDWAKGFPIVDANDPATIHDLIERAMAATRPRSTS